MAGYIKRNLLKFREELISKSLYDSLKGILVAVWLAFVVSPFYHNFSILEFLNRKFLLSAIKLISVVIVTISVTCIAAYIYYRQRFVLIGKDLRTDELTLLPNSRALTNDLPLIIQAARKDNSSLCVIMMDIDDFKAFNSNFTQSLADEVLRKFGGVLKSDNRGTDTIYRQHVKGDEFIVIARDTTFENALKAADRRREFIAKTSINVLGIQEPVQITVCCGVVQLQDDDTTKSLLDRAFEAMKLAKTNPGKNKTEVLV